MSIRGNIPTLHPKVFVASNRCIIKFRASLGFDKFLGFTRLRVSEIASFESFLKMYLAEEVARKGSGV